MKNFKKSIESHQIKNVSLAKDTLNLKDIRKVKAKHITKAKFSKTTDRLIEANRKALDLLS